MNTISICHLSPTMTLAQDELRRKFRESVRRQAETRLGGPATCPAPAGVPSRPRYKKRGGSGLGAKVFGRVREWCAIKEPLLERTEYLQRKSEVFASAVFRANARAHQDAAKTVRIMMDYINGFKPLPTEFQRDMCAAFVELEGPGIYGDEWKLNSLSIQQLHGWVRFLIGIICALTGRKEGKSTGCAMGIVISMFARHGISVALFSRTKEQATIILDMAKVLAATHKHADKFEIRASAHRLRIKLASEKGTINKNAESVCTAYSGDPNVSNVGRARLSDGEGANAGRLYIFIYDSVPAY